MEARRFGRPPKFTAEFIDKAIEYLECYEELGDVIPSIAGLSVHAKISRDQLHAWANGEVPKNTPPERTQDFSDILKAISSMQERKLLNGGLGGSMNPVITKLVLSKHGYSDKKEIDHQSSDLSMSPSFDETKYKAAQDKLKGKLG